jgi:uncharacterized protein (TIGR02996 family)
MNDAGLLPAIRENPEDDTPRLIYAASLEDNGDAQRAEFIRLQCQAARYPEVDLGREAPEAKAQALLARHRQEWERGMPGG